jgi:hypothetical protein
MIPVWATLNGRHAGGVDASDMAGNGTSLTSEEMFGFYWKDFLPQTLEKTFIHPNQVQIVWIKQTLSNPGSKGLSFPDDALLLEHNLKTITQMLSENFPSVRLVYVSSRSFGGCATQDFNPEPYAYQSAFAVKWLIEDHIDSYTQGMPWIAWGPYFWADGTNERKDGLSWNCADFRDDDGTHLSEQGKEKIATILHEFFQESPTSAPWYNP